MNLTKGSFLMSWLIAQKANVIILNSSNSRLLYYRVYFG